MQGVIVIVHAIVFVCYLHSTWTSGALQRQTRDPKVAVFAAFQENQPVARFRLLARDGAPLQPAPAESNPATRGPDPAGRCALADGTHWWDLFPEVSIKLTPRFSQWTDI